MRYAPAGLWRCLLRVTFLAMAIISALIGAPHPVAAHPLGNFSVNRYVRITPDARGLRIHYVIDMAEIPTLQERPQIDADGNGELSAAEQTAYLTRRLAPLNTELDLRIDGQAAALALSAQRMTFQPGEGGLETLRIEADLVAALPTAAGPWQATFHDRSPDERPGWREVVVQTGAGMQILATDAPNASPSAELRSYPADPLLPLRDQRSAQFRFAPGAGPLPGERAEAAPVRATDQLARLVQTPLNGPLALLGVLLTAMGLGAAHALTPGHGKTIVGAYLVGARGTIRHAIFLGLITTVTHTAGVFVLGLITLFVAEFLLPEQLYPWLGAVSGGLIFLIGVLLLRQRWQALHTQQVAADHSHATLDDPAAWHSHGMGAHRHVTPPAVSWGSLLALGVSGGLLPCPSALVLLLGAIALGKAGLGLVLVLAFSLGLAGVLTLIGIVMVRARGLFARLPSGGRLMRVAPLVGAAVVTVAGMGITLQALVQAGLLQI